MVIFKHPMLCTWGKNQGNNNNDQNTVITPTALTNEYEVHRKGLEKLYLQQWQGMKEVMRMGEAYTHKHEFSKKTPTFSVLAWGQIRKGMVTRQPH